MCACMFVYVFACACLDIRLTIGLEVCKYEVFAACLTIQIWCILIIRIGSMLTDYAGYYSMCYVYECKKSNQFSLYMY